MVVLVDFIVFVAAVVVVTAIRQHNRHGVRLHMMPYHHCHCVTQPACCALAHEALSLSPSCNATGMLCACTQGDVVDAIVVIVGIAQRDMMMRNAI